MQLDDLNRRIAGVTDTSSEFYAHLELARLAITLRRQVILLQAVSHAQADPDNPFERFVRELKADQEDIDALAADLTAFLMRLSSLQLDRSHGVRDFVFGSSEVDRLLDAIALLQGLGKLALPEARPADIEIDITRHLDGSVTVYPALEAVTA
ncbi:hypothetical protein [Gordonia phthalatica]|uniref:Uncharacterized protein n=1 Tax=Gordonia phthalatica TaxID=1136941 RepID=A0A0N9NDV9_9ACTN|nr:hypothetical protein [Gordonia phthalatica]ALG85266.1 hypothetical protein ACH46_13245 [Gordonia phthalatica]